ncbi:MAG TPA: LacI family transcriptional regulator [Candidatus Mediterraneibacter norfolkensis]|nr:LacI family transcriptional regulator [Candidatus Mediterraneibacter norfolkensis]
MNIRDIAELAGVSKSTVSRVINNSDSVDSKTRELVLKVIRENNFLPSAMARGLSTQDTNIIGVVLPEVDNSFFGQIIQGINDALIDSPYTMLLCCTENIPEREIKALKALRQQRVRGVLITSSHDFCEASTAAEITNALSSIDAPVVLIDRALKNTPWDGVYSDNVNGAYSATEALAKRGFKKISAFVSDMQLPIGKERFEGFRLAMEKSGIPLDPSQLYLQEFPASMSEVYSFTCELIENQKLPDAIFLSNAIIANGFYKALLEKGIMPGQAIHCVGFNYCEALDILHVPYSYLERNSMLFGQTATEILLQLFKTASPVRKEYIIPAILHLDETLLSITKHPRS